MSPSRIPNHLRAFRGYVVDAVGRRILRSNFDLAKHLGLAYTWLKELPSRGIAPTLVYQVGKVGSSSVFDALREARPTWPIYHIHDLTRGRLAETAECYRRRISEGAGQGAEAVIFQGYFQQFVISLYLRHRLDRGEASRSPWRLITLVRDPVARNLSEFFQNLQLDHPDIFERITAGEVSSELTLYLQESYLAHERARGVKADPFLWFDREMRTVFGLDVFATPFSREVGWQIYQAETASVLLIRLEDLRRVASEAFRAFGIEGVAIGAKNVSTEKQYGPAYEQTSRTIVMPQSVLNALYDSPRTRHFYSEEELGWFRNRWQTACSERGSFNAGPRSRALS